MFFLVHTAVFVMSLNEVLSAFVFGLAVVLDV